MLLMRSDYRQPFGTFSGNAARRHRVAEGYGVMEHARRRSGERTRSGPIAVSADQNAGIRRESVAR